VSPDENIKSLGYTIRKTDRGEMYSDETDERKYTNVKGCWVVNEDGKVGNYTSQENTIVWEKSRLYQVEFINRCSVK